LRRVPTRTITFTSVNTFLNLNTLNVIQRAQYEQAVIKAFPPIISESPVIKKNWSKLEKYFPEYQQFLISSDGQLVGFINAIPFHFQDPLDQLPQNGWDWMFEKGITDYENKLAPNYLGGLQVIVRMEYKKLGFSKEILNHAKTVFKSSNLLNLVIPIRPTKKHKFPEMPMSIYIDLKEHNEIYDPWIRTHVKGGAQIIKICDQSMMMNGDIKFWESMLNREISESGKYKLDGALELITIDLENNWGQYIEPNIWIKYN